MKILFVCSGNICRSAMADEYARRRLASSGPSHIVVDSAGTLGIEGEPAAAESVQVLREEGLDLSRHRSRGVAAHDRRTADLVVGMTVGHLAELERRFPPGTGRRLLLRAFEHGPEPREGAPDLDDPIGMPIETHRETFAVIRKCVDHIILSLRHAW